LLPAGSEEEGGVVARVIGTLARRAVVPAAGAQPRIVEAIHARAVGGLEGQVGPSGRAGTRAHEELVREEEVAALSRQLTAQRSERTIEAFAPLEIRDHEVHVVDEPAAMKLHSLASRPERSRCLSLAFEVADQRLHLEDFLSLTFDDLGKLPDARIRDPRRSVYMCSMKASMTTAMAAPIRRAM
jgi:hypothetical protein